MPAETSAIQAELQKLVRYIEENLRADPGAGLEFVDAKHNRSRLSSRQNHVVFGRRGSGKTSLLKALGTVDDSIKVYINLEDYKDITFPNIVIHVLIQTFRELSSVIRAHHPWFSVRSLGSRPLLAKLGRWETEMRALLHDPDEEMQEVSTRETRTTEKGTSLSAKSVLSATLKQGDEAAREVKRNLSKSKLDYLRLELVTYKHLIAEISEHAGGKPILLILDDLYFVPKATQPDLVDFFHRLTKGTALFLKIATIKHRSKLYRRDRSGTFIGTEIGHDVFAIDMDYTLDNFAELEAFMRQLLERAIVHSGTSVQFEELFSGGGFAQLCLASGGVPRDFLSLFVGLANQTVASGSKIGKLQVTDAAIGANVTKIEAMKKDSGSDDEILADYLASIKKNVYQEKRTNAFLVARDDLDGNPHGRQAIRELVDLRLIHLVDQNTSKAPSDGRRYEAYIIDVGMYDNSRPSGFTQVEPGARDERARKDDLRAAPVFDLSRLDRVPVKPPATAVRGSSRPQLQLSYE